MSGERDSLRDGACMDLPPQVVDRYFMANGSTERFETETARAICGRCAVRAVCLLQAIQEIPPEIGIRAGQSASALSKLHAEAIAGTPVRELVNRTLRNQRDVKRLYLHPKPSKVTS